MLDTHLIVTILISIILFVIVAPYFVGTKYNKYIDIINQLLDGEIFE